jgi:calcium-dependent protein kinase
MKGVYDQKCDIWSAGVILYILVTGVPPFNGATDEDILKQVRKMTYTFDIPEMKKTSVLLKELISLMLVEASKRPSA